MSSEQSTSAVRSCPLQETRFFHPKESRDPRKPARLFDTERVIYDQTLRKAIAVYALELGLP